MARPKINPDFTTINCAECHQDFQVKWAKRNKQRYCSKTCSANSTEVKEKNRVAVAKTFSEKYGAHPMTTENTKKNLRDSMMKKYGKEHSMQIKSCLDKAKKTNMTNFGVENVLSKNSSVRKKIEETWIEKYGTNNICQVPEFIEKRRKSKQINHYEELLSLFNGGNLDWLVKMEDYEGYHFSKRYNFLCKVCNHAFESTVYVPQSVFCEVCHPKRKQSGENTLLEFLNTELNGKTIIRHDRLILNGKELDFYIPELKLAIEYNGLYWHREGPKISKNYHLDKTTKCVEKGIRLLHIFETEWLYNQNIVKSIIRQSIGSAVVKIHGRECEVRIVDNETKKNFLKICHIQGNDTCSAAYGLYYKNNLVSLMTFCRSRFDKKYEWEISRFCNALNTKIHGGASKLFSIFLQDYNPKSVVSYSDRRYFSGDVYGKLGLKFVGFTAQGYHYISTDYKALFNRQMYQKNKLEKKLDKFDPLLSEWDNMKVNGFDRIWDCGHSKWVYEQQKS